jgi:hypothetical protein
MKASVRKLDTHEQECPEYAKRTKILSNLIKFIA